jgi:chromosome segregation ATPase
MLKSKKKILSEINLKIDETFKAINDNFSDTVMEKDKQLGKYEEQIETLATELSELKERYKNLSAKAGGLTRGNNKLKSDKVILEKEVKNKNKIIQSQLQAIEVFREKSVEIEKLRAVILQQEKIISKKILGTPSKEKIINYDRKAPIMK